MANSDLSTLPDGYDSWLFEVKARIRNAQTRAALAVNAELVLLYWQIGREILERQNQRGWGGKVVEKLSSDLKREFPEMKGFSSRNLKYMRAFASAWPEIEFVQEVLAQITWYHNIALIEKISDAESREWYAHAAIQHGWSRTILVHQIETKLHLRQGKAVTNFERTLPSPQSELAQQILKDPYNFDFLSLGDDAHERDLEKALLENIRRFLLEMGEGFAFVGNQYRLEVGGDEFFIDLLLYHLRLRCFVVIDLKMRDFQPEFAGKMNFYLSAVDDLLRHENDASTIGLILCKTKNKFVAEYALRDINKPLGVAAQQWLENFPEPLQNALPTIEQLEAELEKTMEQNL